MNWETDPVTAAEAASKSGEKLKQYRIGKDLTQVELAKRVGISPSAIRQEAP